MPIFDQLSPYILSFEEVHIGIRIFGLHIFSLILRTVARLLPPWAWKSTFCDLGKSCITVFIRIIRSRSPLFKKFASLLLLLCSLFHHLLDWTILDKFNYLLIEFFIICLRNIGHFSDWKVQIVIEIFFYAVLLDDCRFKLTLLGLLNSFQIKSAKPSFYFFYCLLTFIYFFLELLM